MNELAKVETKPGSLAECSAMVQAAIANNVSGDALKQMFETYRDTQRFAAEAAYAEAMTAFQRECPPMPRTHESPYTRVNRAGVKVQGRYTDLADIGKTIAPILARHGLSWDWEDTELVEVAGVACYRSYIRIRHEHGHSERKSGPPVPLGEPVRRSDGTAAQSPQAHASSVITTAQRLCLRSAFGLWSIDPDEEDAVKAAEGLTPLSDEQTETLETLLAEYGKATNSDTSAMRTRMLKACGCGNAESLAAIPPDRFGWVAARLREHIEKARKAKV